MRTKSSSATKMYRRNWALPEATVRNIQSIRENTGAATDTEVVKRAVSLFRRAIENQDLGVKVIFRQRNGKETEVEFY